MWNFMPLTSKGTPKSLPRLGLINKKNIGSKHCNGSKTFIKYSNHMADIQENIEEHNPNEKNAK